MRQFFKVTSGDTSYMGKEGKESEAGSFYLGCVLVASVGGTERRTLGPACPGSPVQDRN